MNKFKLLCSYPSSSYGSKFDFSTSTLLKEFVCHHRLLKLRSAVVCRGVLKLWTVAIHCGVLKLWTVSIHYGVLKSWTVVA